MLASATLQQKQSLKRYLWLLRLSHCTILIESSEIYGEWERSASDDLAAVLRIRDILVRIRIRSSYWVTDPPDPAIFVNDLHDGN